MRMHLLLRHLLFILVLISSTANAITGPEVAQLLNTRYNNTAAICVGNNPAYYCNGVLVQAIPADHPLEFWKHGTTAIALGAEQVAYLRKDLSIRALSQKNGVVFADQFTAISQNKPLDVLCAYPVVAEIQSTRPRYGCALAVVTSEPTVDNVVEHELDPSVIGENAVVRLDYRDEAIGDRVQIRWNGSISGIHDSELQIVQTANTPLMFNIEKHYVTTNIGGTVTVTAYVHRPGDKQYTSVTTFSVKGPSVDTAKNVAEDPSSCETLGVNDAQGWLAYFQGQNNDPQRQCSLSSRQPSLFEASLDAHELLGSEGSVKPNQLLLKNWDEQTPARIPLQALFYDATQAGALLGAQRDQRDYFMATGEWLPVLRMALNDETHTVFGFNLQDQLYIGYQVASKLNARYADTSAYCPGGTAAYNCNGVLIRVTDASPDFHAWNPSPGSVTRNGVSFSYLRADIISLLAWVGSQGLIIKELAAPTGYPLIVRCSYPYDGATIYRTDSCNAHNASPAGSKPCDEQGITSVTLWHTYFYALASKLQGCSFKGDPTPFELSVVARASMEPADQQEVHNEVIIAAWPQDIPKQLPLEAFFYSVHSSLPTSVRAHTGLEGAQFMQRDYTNNTGRFMPIIHVHVQATDGDIFTYSLQDQNLHTGSSD